VRHIADGGSLVDPSLVEELVRAKRQPDHLSNLTAREREVLELLAQGRTDRGIAQELFPGSEDRGGACALDLPQA
jgi:serine/threonine-protein kinase PknK